MATNKKTDFVENYPYLVYAPDADTIAIEGGGEGGSSWELLAQKDIAVNTTSTSQVDVGSVSVPGIGALRDTGSKTIVIFIFDKEGIRASNVYGSASYSCRVTSLVGTLYYAKADGTLDYSAITYGVFPYITNDGITVRARCNQNFATIDSTFDVRVYALDFPSDFAPFDDGE